MRKGVYIVGKRVGRLVVIKRAGTRRDKSGRAFSVWLCKCDCGNEKEVQRSSLTRGSTKSCGCWLNEIQQFGSLIKPYQALYNKLMSTMARRKRKFTEPAMMYEEFLEFTKTSECHYCAATIKWSAHAIIRNGSGYNLDRKDNEIGYTKDNCVACCKRCNWAKLDHFTYEQWRDITAHMRTKPEFFGIKKETNE